MSWEELLEQIDAYEKPLEFWDAVTETLGRRVDEIMSRM